MKYIKNEMRNRMGDQWMNGCLVVYIERDVAYNIDNETIMQQFQNMKFLGYVFACFLIVVVVNI